MRHVFSRAGREVRKILWEDWDPIGCGVPQDEYDDYVGPVLRLLIERAGADAVRAYLVQTATETIGCPPIEETQAGLERALGKLMAIDVTGEKQ